MITERAIPVEEAKQNFNKILENNKVHKSFGSFKVIDKISRDFLGSALLRINNLDSDEAEIGYVLLPNYWGKRLGSKIVELLLNRARKESQLNYLKAFIDPNNVASKKILTNNGFVTKETRYIDDLLSEILTIKLNR